MGTSAPVNSYSLQKPVRLVALTSGMLRCWVAAVRLKRFSRSWASNASRSVLACSSRTMRTVRISMRFSVFGSTQSAPLSADSVSVACQASGLTISTGMAAVCARAGLAAKNVMAARANACNMRFILLSFVNRRAIFGAFVRFLGSGRFDGLDGGHGGCNRHRARCRVRFCHIVDSGERFWR